ncbi:ATP-binding protein [Salibacterium lacus]|uniref:AAA family ATPase n=1 Tax=Salibacterium lacus TaxID=1898109 RepID=A0ABW5SYK0_9BACI
MRIEALHIYGFGKFQDEKITVDSSFHVFQGKNETGKSTIRAFIQAVLFGFPSKKEQARRYEPKEGSRHGGSLTIRLEDGTQAVVERTAGKKSAGEVLVYTGDGRQHGAEWLEGLLGSLDRGMFQGIFCFGLEGLGEIQQLQGSDLNQYIYEAGMTGTKHIASIEKKLQHHLDQLYKPKGQKPEMNVLLQELHEHKKELREWEARFDTYDRLVRQREDIESKQAELKHKKADLKVEKEQLQRRKTLLSVYRELQEVYHHVQRLEPFEHVSLDWEEQSTAYHEQRKEAAAEEEKQALAEQQLAGRNQGAAVNRAVRETRDSIYALKEKLPVYRKYREDYNRLQQEAARHKKNLEEKQRRLGIAEESELAGARTTMSAEEELHDITEKAKGLQERIRLLEEQVQQHQDQLALLQKDLDTHEQYRRSEEEKRHSRDAVDKQQTGKNGTRPLWQHPVLLLQLASVIFFTLGMWEMITGHWLMGLIMFGAGLSAAVLWILQHQFRAGKSGADNPDKDTAQQTAELHADQRLETTIREKQWEYDREVNAYQSTLDKKQEAREKQQELEDVMEKWAATHDIPSPSSLLQASAFFTAVQEWQKEQRQLQTVEKEIKTLAQLLSDIEQETAEAAAAAGISAEPVEKTIHAALNIVEKEETKHREYEQDLRDWETVRSRKHYYRARREQAEHSIQNLYHLSGVHSEEEFQQAVEAKKQYNEWKAKENWLLDRMRRSLADQETTAAWFETFENDDRDPDEAVQDIEETEQELDTEEDGYRNKLAAVHQEIRTVEEGGTYEQMLQQYEEKKSKLHHLARTWKTYRAAREILNEAKSMYEQERQPEVIRKASSYFSYLTASHYERLFAPLGEETFIVEDNRGFRFTPEELSRGTAEQLYLSLRLALAESYHHNQTLPFILDDPFVNFDRERQSMVFSLLTNLSSRRQILYFTCEHIPESPSGIRHRPVSSEEKAADAGDSYTRTLL